MTQGRARWWTFTLLIVVAVALALPQSVSASVSVTSTMQNTGGNSPRGRICDTWTLGGVAAGTSVTIDMLGAPTGHGSLGDPYLHVLDSSGRQVSFNDDGGTGLNARLTVTWQNGYYIGASVFSSGSGASYRLSVSRGSSLTKQSIASGFPCNAPPKQNQTINFPTPASQTYGAGRTFSVSATATSGLAVSFTSSTTTICTVTSTGTVTIQRAGTCTLTASQPGNINWNAASNVTRSFSITQASQSITFSSIANRTFSSATSALSATATSNLSVSYRSLTTSVCVLSGTQVSVLRSGTCSIEASQPGDVNFLAAAAVTRSFTVEPAPQSVSFEGATQNLDFGFTGGSQTFTVPPGVTSVTIEAWGAQGGNITSHQPIDGGLGGRAKGTLTVTPGQVVQINVGGQAPARLGNHPYPSCTQAPGGWNGGGSSFSAGNSTGGGGASDVRVNGTGLANRVIVAGGGGGGGWTYSRGGVGGGSVGGAGTNVNQSGTGAGGGTQSAGGAAGVTGGSCAGGRTAGSLGQGGAGSGNSAGGGGGGGGYYGGGGGGYAEGGGGGSNFLGGVTQTDQSPGVRSGNGLVRLSFTLVDEIIDVTVYTPRLLAVSGVATSGLTPELTSQTPGVCAITSGSVQLLTVGTCTLRLSQSGNDQFRAAVPLDRTFQVVQAPQQLLTGAGGEVLQVAGSADVTSSASVLGGLVYGAAPVVVSAMTSAERDDVRERVTFRSTTPQICTVTQAPGATTAAITIEGAGVCTVGVRHDGAEWYQPAAEVLQTFTIAPRPLTISASVASRVYNAQTGPGAVSVGDLDNLVGSETLRVTFTASNYASPNVGTQSTTLTFALADGTNGGRAANYTLAPLTVAGEVTPRALSVRVTDISRTTDEAEQVFDADVLQVVGLAPGDVADSASFAFNGSSTQPVRTAVSTSTVTASALVVTNPATGGTNLAGNYTITYLPGSYSRTVGAPAQLVVDESTAGAPSGARFDTMPTVRIRDAGGNPITSGADSRLTISATASQGTLVGVTSVSSFEGVARFATLGLRGSTSVNPTVTYAATWNGTALTQATQTITLTPGAPVALAVVGQPAALDSGVPATDSLVVQVRDADGNRVDTSTASITVSQPTAGAQLSGVRTVNAVQGVATFPGLTLTGTTRSSGDASPYRFRVQAAGLTAADSAGVGLLAGPAARVALTTRSVGVASGVVFGTQPAVTVYDAAGNVVVDQSITVSATVIPRNDSGSFLTGATTATAVTDNNGVAQFTGLGLHGFAGAAHRIEYRGVNANGSTFGLAREDVTVTVGPPASLRVDRAGTEAASGVAMAVPPRLAILDSGGNLTAVSAGTLTVTVGSSVPTATVGVSGVTVSNGVAQLGSLTLTGPASANGVGPYTLTFSYAPAGGGSPLQITSPLSLVPGVPHRVSTSAGAQSIASGATLPTVTAWVEDSAGNVVPGHNLEITASLSGGGDRTLVGGRSRRASAELTEFTALRVRGLVGAQTLTLSAPGLESTDISLTLTHGAPARLVGSVTTGSPVNGGAVTFEGSLRDLEGSLVVSHPDITHVRARLLSDGQLSGTTTANATAGEVTLSGVVVEGPTSRVTEILFEAVDSAGVVVPGVAPARASFPLGAGTPASLVLVQPAAGVVSGETFTRQPQIHLRDSFGNRATTSSDAVTVSVVGAGGESLGTTTVNADQGVATFTGVGLRGTVGTDYVLQFTSGQLPAVTQSVRVAAGAAASLHLTSSTALTAASGSTLSAGAVVLELRDAQGNVLTDASAFSVTVSISAGEVTGGVTRRPVNGVVDFSGLRLRGPAGAGHTITFTATGPVTLTTTAALTFTPGAPAQLHLLTPPQGSLTADAATLAFAAHVVEVRDSWGNPVPGAGVAVTAQVPAPVTLVGTPSVATAADGRATLSALSAAGWSGTHRIAYRSEGLAPAFHTVTIAPGQAARLALEPGLASVRLRRGDPLDLNGGLRVVDAAGNTVPLPVGWQVTVSAQVGGAATDQVLINRQARRLIGTGGTLEQTLALSAASDRTEFDLHYEMTDAAGVTRGVAITQTVRFLTASPSPSVGRWVTLPNTITATTSAFTTVNGVSVGGFEESETVLVNVTVRNASVSYSATDGVTDSQGSSTGGDGVTTLSFHGAPAAVNAALGSLQIKADSDLRPELTVTAEPLTIAAAGGTVSDVVIDGQRYRIHGFTTVGNSTFTVSAAAPTSAVDYLIVGGGGGGADINDGGGGGAGGVVAGSVVPLQPLAHAVVVGAGGVRGSSGQSSTFNGQDAGGGQFATPTPLAAPMCFSGGSSGTPQSNGGGNGFACSGASEGGGGGGAGGTGLPGSTSAGGAGGPGLYFGDLFTTSFGDDGWFASGGSGGGEQVAAVPPQGGGGKGGRNTTQDERNGKPGTGGGGGGNNEHVNSTTTNDNTLRNAGAGGSGVVLIRYALPGPFAERAEASRSVALTPATTAPRIIRPAQIFATTSAFTPVPGVSVSGFTDLPDNAEVLITVTVSNGAEVTYSATTGVINSVGFESSVSELSFSGSQADVNLALETLRIKVGDGDPELEIRAVLGGEAYNPATGTYYEVVTTSATVTWEESRCRALYVNGTFNGTAESTGDRPSNRTTLNDPKCVASGGESLVPRTLNGLRGYLTNITSEDEHRFLTTKLTSGQGWMGGSDIDTEGEWLWMDGPEKGTVFWRGATDNPNVRKVNTIEQRDGQSRSVFNYWSDGEPNNSGGEHFSEFGFGGNGIGRSWNDCRNGCGSRTQFIVEYGGFDDDLPTFFAAANIEVNIPVLSVSSVVSAEVASGTTLAAQPVVSVVGPDGLLIPTLTGTVSAQLVNSDGVTPTPNAAAELLCAGTENAACLSVPVVNGRAVFEGIGLRGEPGGFRLRFTITDDTGASYAQIGALTSSSITLVAGTDAELVLITEATSTGVGQPLTTSQLEFRDAQGNLVPDVPGQVTVCVTGDDATCVTPEGVALDGVTTGAATAVGGKVEFAGLVLRGPPGTYTLRYSSGSYVVTQSVTVGLGTPAVLDLTRDAEGAPSGQAFTISPQVTIRDASGNIVTTATTAVTASVESVSLEGQGTGTLIGTTTATPVNGVVTFTDLGLEGRSSLIYRLTLSADGMSPVTQVVTVSAGTSVSLEILNAPTQIRSGVAGFVADLQARDAQGNPASTDEVTVSVLTGAGDPVGSDVVASVSSTPNATARAAAVEITGPVGAYTLRYALVSNPQVSASAAVQLRPGLPSTVSLSATTLSGVAGQIFDQLTSAPLTVWFRDAEGNVLTEHGLLRVDQPTTVVTATLTAGPAGALLTGTTSYTLTNATEVPVATFSDLRIEGPPGTYTLSFTAPEQTADVATLQVVIEAAPAAAVEIISAASSAQVDQPFTEPTVLQIIDALGNPVTLGTAPTVTVTVEAGATVSTTPTVVWDGATGQATISGVALRGEAGRTYGVTYTLTEGSHTFRVVQPVVLSAGAAHGLAVLREADGSRLDQADGQPIIAVVDLVGNPVTQNATTITAAVVQIDGRGEATGTTSAMTDINGVATFDGLGLRGDTGRGYQLVFSATGLEPVTQSVRVMVGEAAALALVDPLPEGTLAAGTRFATAPVVTLVDGDGNPQPGVTATVTASVHRVDGTALGSEEFLIGDTSAAFASGYATFDSLGLAGRFNTAYEIHFTAAGYTTVTHSVTVAVGPPAQITVGAAEDQIVASSGVPVRAMAGTDPAPLTVSLRDAGGNLITDVAGTVVATLECTIVGEVTCVGAQMTGTLTQPLTGGVASFDDLTLAGTAGHRPVITFSLFGVGTATVQPTVSAGPAAELRLGHATLNGASGAALDTVPEIRITDSGGNLITSGDDASLTVTATLTRVTVAGEETGNFRILDGSNVSAANLVDGVILAVTTTAVNGVARFEGLGLDGVDGRSYTLTFTATSAVGAPLTGVDGANLRTGAPASIHTQVAAAGANSGAAFNRQPQIVIRDTGGNPVDVPVTVSAQVTQINGTGELVGPTSAVTVNGVATFTGLGLTGTEGSDYTLTFTAQHGPAESPITLGTVTTQSVTMGVGAPVALEFVTEPGGASSGLTLATQPVVRVVDTGGNTVTASTAEVTVKIDDPADGITGSRLLGVTTSAAVDGVARFASLGLRGIVGTTYTLTFQAQLSGEERNVTTTIQVAPGVPASFTVSTSAAGAASGQAFTTQPQIRILDAEGNTVTASQARVTAAVSGGDGQGRLIGPVFADAVNGVATFTGLGLTGTTGSAYTLTYAVAGLSSLTEAVPVVTGPPTRLEILTAAGEPAGADAASEAGVAFGVQPVLRFLDSGGNLVTDDTLTVIAEVIPLEVLGRAPPVILGTTTSAVNETTGLATFTNLGLGGVSDVTYTLRYRDAASGSTVQPVTQPMVLRPGSPAALALRVEAPAESQGGRSFTPSPRVAVVDAYANTIPGAAGRIEAQIAPVDSQAGSGLLLGITGRQVFVPGSIAGLSEQQLARVGLATFDGLGARGQVGEQYHLTFTMPGASPAVTPVSQIVRVVAGAPVALSVRDAAAGAVAGQPFATAPQVAIRDAEGNRVINSTATVTARLRPVLGTGEFTVADGSPVVAGALEGGVLREVSVAAVEGIATFTGLGLNGREGTAYEIEFTAVGLRPTVDVVTAEQGAPARLELAQPLTGGAAGVPFSPQPRVRVLDAGGNPVTSPVTVAARVATASAPATFLDAGLVGTRVITTSLGEARFTDLGLNGTAGVNYVVSFVVLDAAGEPVGATPATQTLAGRVGPAIQVTLATPPAYGSTADRLVTGARFTQQPVIVVRDGAGNLVTDRVLVIARVALAEDAPATTGAATLLGAREVMSLNGFATFADLGLSGEVGGAYALSFGGPGLTPVSITFTLDDAAPGFVPTFGTPLPTPDGFRVQITNYDPSVTYTGQVTFRGTSAPAGQVAVDGNGLVFVTGTPSDRELTLTILTAKNGHASEARSIDARAGLGLALVPTFGAPTAQPNGFTVPVTNYAFSHAWSTRVGAVVNGEFVADPAGGPITAAFSISGALTVRGMPADRAEVAVEVTTRRSGHVPGTAVVTGSALPITAAPVFGTPVRVEGGFDVEILNATVSAGGYGDTDTYPSGVIYTWNLPVGVTVSQSASTGYVEVRGLAAGRDATVLLQVQRVEEPASRASAAVTGRALAEGLIPTLTDEQATATGWEARIANYDPASTWTVSTTVGTATVVVTGGVARAVITGADAAESVTLTVSTTRPGVALPASVSRTFTRGAGLVPTLGDLEVDAAGFSLEIENYDPAYTWTVTAAADATAVLQITTGEPVGDAAPTVSARVRVTFGEVDEDAATVTVTAARLGARTQQTVYTYSAAPGLVPEVSAVEALEQGFRFTVTNHDASVSAGVTVIPVLIGPGTITGLDASGMVTVSGIPVGSSTTVILSSGGAGVRSEVLRVTGTALPGPAITVALGAPVRTQDGFTVQITTYDPDWAWTVGFVGTPPEGAVVELDENPASAPGLITVSGLSASTTVTIEVSAQRAGYTDATPETLMEASLNGGSLIPILGPISATDDEFSAPIVNFDAAFTFTASSSAPGSTVSITDGVLTVTGLGVGNLTTTVTVSASRAEWTTTEVTYRLAALDSAGLPALATGLTPRFGTVTRRNDGFAVEIGNFDTSFSWTALTNRGATVTVDTATGEFILSGLTPNAADTLTVFTNRDGFLTGVAQISGRALRAGERATNLLSEASLQALCPHGSPDDGQLANLTDLVAATSFDCFIAADRGLSPYAVGSVGFTTGDLGPTILTGVSFTRATQATSSADPLTYTLWGCAEQGRFCTVIVNGDSTGLVENRDATRRIRNERSFSYYRLTFGSVRGATNRVSIGEIGFIGQPAIRQGPIPQFAEPVLRPDGFDVAITNFCGLCSWEFTAGAPARVSLDRSVLPPVLRVRNLDPSVTRTLTVTTRRPGFTDGVASITATTLRGSALVPQLSGATLLQGATGLQGASGGSMRVMIDNFDAPGFTWVATATAEDATGSAVPVPAEQITISSAGLVRVTGLDVTAGATVRITVTASQDGFDDGSDTVEAVWLNDALVPAVAGLTPTADGYVVTITNYNEIFEWAITADRGAAVEVTVTGATVTVTVSGLTAGTSANLTARTEREGYWPGITRISGTAIPLAFSPTFGTVTATADGLVLPILNFDPTYTWTVTASAAGEVVGTVTLVVLPDGSAELRLSGVTPEELAEPSFGFEILITRPGTTSVVLTHIPQIPDAEADDGLEPAIELELGTIPDPAPTTFAVPILNAASVTTVSAQVVPAGLASVTIADGWVTVSGAPQGALLTLVITTEEPGHRTAVQRITIRIAGLPGLTPALSTPVAVTDGFTTQITNLDPAYTFTAEAVPSNGTPMPDLTASVTADGLVVVEGIVPGATATVTVTATRDGHTPGVTTVTAAGRARPGLVPQLGEPVVTRTGFRAVIINHDPAYLWAESVDSGAQVSIQRIGEDMVLVVEGAPAFTEVLAVLTTSRAGYLPANTPLFVTTLPLPALTPIMGVSTSTVDGYRVGIRNFDPTYTWTATTTTCEMGCAVTPPAAVAVTWPLFDRFELRSEVAPTGFQPGYVVSLATGAGAVVRTARITEIREVPASTEAAHWIISLSHVVEPEGAAPVMDLAQMVSTGQRFTWADVSSDGMITVHGVPSGTFETFTLRSARVDSIDGTRSFTAAARPGQSTVLGRLQILHAAVSGGLATVTMAASHGLTLGMPVEVLISGLGPAFDGFHTATPVSETGVSFVRILEAQAASERAAVVRQVTGAVSVSAVSVAAFDESGPRARLVVGASHGILPGDQVTLSADAATVSAASVVNAVVLTVEEDVVVVAAAAGVEEFILEELAEPVTLTFAGTRRQRVTTLSAAGGLATVALDGLHEFVVGDTVVIDAAGLGFSGTHTVTALSATELTFAFVIDQPVTGGVLRTGSDLVLEVLLSPSEIDDVNVQVTVPFSVAQTGTLVDAMPAMTEAVGAGYRVISITATGPDGGSVTELDDQLRLLFEPPAEGAVPVTSSDEGLTWEQLPLLSTPDLPPGQRDGYYIDADGNIWIITRHLSMFGVLAPQALPLIITVDPGTLAVGGAASVGAAGGEGDGELTVVTTTPGVCALSEDEDGMTLTALAAGACELVAERGSSGRFIATQATLTVLVSGPSGAPGGVFEVDTPAPTEPEETAPPVETPTPTPAPAPAEPAAPEAPAPRPTRPTPAPDTVADRIADSVERIARPVPVPPATDPVWEERPVAATEGDREVEVRTSPRAVGTGITVEGDTFALEVVARDVEGTEIELDEQARLILRSGGTVRVEGSGYAPFTPVVIWMFSDPVKLGEVMTDADGAFVAELQVPDGLQAGLHLIQINGVTAEGELRSVTFPVVLTERSPAEDGEGVDVPVEVDAEEVDPLGAVGTNRGVGLFGAGVGLLLVLLLVALRASRTIARRQVSAGV
jgi:hypothetical protein